MSPAPATAGTVFERPPRRTALRLGVIATAGVLLRPFTADALVPGAVLPELVLRTDSGELRLAERRGEVLWIDFWASWCAPCRQSFPWMHTLQGRYAARGLQVVAVNLDSKPEPARRFLAEHPVSFPVAFDPQGDSARRAAVRAMPTSLLVDADGRVALVHAGFRDSDRAMLETAVEAALVRRSTTGGGR